MTDLKITQLPTSPVISGVDLIPFAFDATGTPETRAITFGDFLSSAEPALEAAFTGKKTVYVPVNSMSPTTTSGCASVAQVELSVNRPEINHMAFDDTGVENAIFAWSFPKSWDEGVITFQPYWTGLVAGGGGVSWKLGAVAVSNDDPIDTDYGTKIEVVDTFIAAEDLHIGAESDPVTIAGTPAQGDKVYFVVQRDPLDASDTRAQDANLVGLKIFYDVDSLTDD